MRTTSESVKLCELIPRRFRLSPEKLNRQIAGDMARLPDVEALQHSRNTLSLHELMTKSMDGIAGSMVNLAMMYKMGMYGLEKSDDMALGLLYDVVAHVDEIPEKVASLIVHYLIDSGYNRPAGEFAKKFSELSGVK